jgi:hypothetical protein
MKKPVKILLFISMIGFVIPKSFAQISVGLSISVGTPPPALPVYEQPPCPTDGYLWQPGYWAYDDADGYYWVPGVWVAPPTPGLLWTPAYWGYEGGHYGFHQGYWGPHVGFYGGINYGFGYGGVGFGGGAWSGGHFRYNTAVVNVNRTVVHNTYVDRTVIRNTTVNNRSSFNGPGGSKARPSAQDERAMKEHHVQPTSAQLSHQQGASRDKGQFAKTNNGRPASAATNKVGGRSFNPTNHKASGTAFGHGKTEGGKAPGNAPRPENAGRPEQAEKKESPAAEHKAEAPERTEKPEKAPAAVRHTPTQRAPQQHTQPQQRAPQQRTQPQRAPQQHAPQQHTQPHSAPRAAGGGHGKHR